MSVTEEIKSRINIVDYIAKYVPIKKSGRYYKACCPFHSEKTPSFVVNEDTQTWRCFGACAEGGDLFSFATKFHNWSFSEALQELGDQAGVEIRKQSPQQKEQNERLDKLRGMLQTAADFYHNYLISSDEEPAKATYRYAREKRGFTHETLVNYQIGYAPDGWRNMLDALLDLGYSENDIVDAGIATRNDKGRVYDRFRNRLMIPIRDDRGRIVGFGARALAPDDNPKYLNSPQSVLFDKSRLLFGLDVAKDAIRESGMVVIVEGYMDAIQAHQAGFRNVVAQMGTAFTDKQLSLVVPRHANRVIMALDADEAGQNATRRSLEVVRQTLQADYAGKLSVDIRVLQIPGAKDPDDLLRESPEQWQGLIDSAQPIADFVIALETSELDIGSASVQEKQAAARRVLPLLTASEDNIYNRDNLQKLSLKLRVPEEDLLAWAREIQQEEAKRAQYQQRSTPPPSADEPPPLPDDLMPPPDYDDDLDYDVIPPDLMGEHRQQAAKTNGKPSMLVSRDANREAERYCLRMLLRDPDLLVQINRKLRELAHNQPELLDGPLSELSEDDFSQGDYRVMMQVFHEAMRQDDMEPLDYLRNNLDDELVEELERLLVHEEQELRNQVQNRFSADFARIMQQYQRYSQPSMNPQEDVTWRLLEMRAKRLMREREEMKFLQTDALRQRDPDTAQAYDQPMWLSMQAKRYIELELRGGIR